MASAISKRQQARNERALQDLIRTVPGNDRCADCSAKNPGWASWNLGVFLCLRCAALHRKLGTHVSKVKSLSMDSWSTEQVDRMKKVGNVASNKEYNPRNVKPDIPVDADQVDSAIDKYIRQKYDTRALSTGSRGNAPTARQNTGSTGTDLGSWNEEPPDLPPKPTKKFGFTLRSSSSTYPRTKPDRFTPPMSPARTGSERSAELPSPKKDGKPPKLFGMRITTIDNNFNSKLSTLQDMGFSDSARNTDILKSMNGNLDKAIEELVRLGENAKPLSRSVTPGATALTPVSMRGPASNGVMTEKKADPWEIRDEARLAVPPRASSVPPASAQASSWNPFLQSDPQAQPQQSIESKFQGLSLSAASSPIHQNYGMQQGLYQNHVAQQPTNPWQTPQTQQPAMTTTYGQQSQQAPTLLQLNNPFMQPQSQAHALSPTNPWAQQQAPVTQQSSNPFGTSWQQQGFSQQIFAASPQPIYGQQTDFFSEPQQRSQSQPQQQQQQYQTSSQQPIQSTGNPWQQQSTQQSYQAAQQQPQVQQTQPPQQQQVQQIQRQQPPLGQYGQQQYMQQQPARHDKSSILALYNHPQFAPQRALQTLPEDGTLPQQPVNAAPQRSVTMPVSSTNPFGQPPNQPQGFNHVSKESIDFQGFTNTGRHSPDAFSGLSARYVR